jgi:hypothetical protein
MVCALSNDTAFIEYDDLLGILDRGDALGYDEQRTLTGVFLERPPQD